jgi:cytochrome c553
MKMTFKIGLMTALLVVSAPVLAADAKANYEKHCAKCHGPDGRGQTKMGKQAGAKDYTDPKVQAEMDDAKAMKSIKEGQKVNGKEAMKPFGDKLSDDEIKALIAHLRAFKK